MEVRWLKVEGRVNGGKEWLGGGNVMVLEGEEWKGKMKRCETGNWWG